MSNGRKVRRIERGWAGHFILADKCRFRRNTLLDFGKKKIVVSTVGNYHDNNGKLDTIGHKRHYETMAFNAVKEGNYWDGNVLEYIPFHSNWGIEVTDKNIKNVDNLADKMHETVVAEIIRKYGRRKQCQKEEG